MRLFRILTLKELNGYFLTPFGWVILAFVTLMQGISLSTAMKGFRDTPVRDSLVYVTFHTPLFSDAVIQTHNFANTSLLTKPRCWRNVFGPTLSHAIEI